MTEHDKTWVIGITDDLGIQNPDQEQRTPTRRHVPLETRLEPPAAPHPAPRPAPRPAARPAPELPRSRRLQYATLVLLTYLLGPFALLLTTAGRRDRVAVIAGCAAAIGAVAMGFYRGRLLASVGAGWAAVGLGLLVAALVLVAFSAWARALQVTRAPDQATRLRDAQTLPHWLRRPWVMGALSLIGPGAGMLLAGRTWRAATVLWSAFAAVLATVTLVEASWWWGIAHGESPGLLRPAHVELMFVGAGIVLALSFVGWIAQALEGVRQGLLAAGRSGSGRGDRAALALGFALLAMFIAVSPARIASELDYRADRLQLDGYRIIPLGLTLGAQRLDPARPAYAVQASRLYAELGMTDQAVRTIEHLRAEVEPVLAALELPATGPEPAATPRATPLDRPAIQPPTMLAAQTEPAPAPADSAPAAPSDSILDQLEIAGDQAEAEPQAEPEVVRTLQSALMGSMAPPDPQ